LGKVQGLMFLSEAQIESLMLIPIDKETKNQNSETIAYMCDLDIRLRRVILARISKLAEPDARLQLQ